MWINVGFSFGFIKMILLMIFLAASVYLYFDWNYVSKEAHNDIDTSKNSTPPPSNLSTSDEFLKKHKEDFFKH